MLFCKKKEFEQPQRNDVPKTNFYIRDPLANVWVFSTAQMFTECSKMISAGKAKSAGI